MALKQKSTKPWEFRKPHSPGHCSLCDALRLEKNNARKRLRRTEYRMIAEGLSA